MCDDRETCTVTLVRQPARPEFPWRVRCSRCGWVDHFDSRRVAGMWAWRHDHTHDSEGERVPGQIPFCAGRTAIAHSPTAMVAAGAEGWKCLECGETERAPSDADDADQPRALRPNSAHETSASTGGT